MHLYSFKFAEVVVHKPLTHYCDYIQPGAIFVLMYLIHRFTKSASVSTHIYFHFQKKNVHIEKNYLTLREIYERLLVHYDTGILFNRYTQGLCNSLQECTFDFLLTLYQNPDSMEFLVNVQMFSYRNENTLCCGKDKSLSLCHYCPVGEYFIFDLWVL